MRRIAWLLLATACASASEPGELAIAEPEAALADAEPRVPSAARELVAHPSDDPCAAPHPSGRVAELCEASRFDESCVGLVCARTRSRDALECMLEDGVDTETFVALSRSDNPVTRVYAREALLRRDAMTTELIIEGLTDAGVVEHGYGCIRDMFSAAEPAFVALLQRDDDALLRAFIGSSTGRAMLLDGYTFTRTSVLRATLSLADQPHRSETLRASVRALAVEAADHLPASWDPATRVMHLTPMPPADALADWTRAHGCTPKVEHRERVDAAKERERLLQIERELRAVNDRARAE